jgi:hypothetical protein
LYKLSALQSTGIHSCFRLIADNPNSEDKSFPVGESSSFLLQEFLSPDMKCVSSPYPQPHIRIHHSSILSVAYLLSLYVFEDRGATLRKWHFAVSVIPVSIFSKACERSADLRFLEPQSADNHLPHVVPANTLHISHLRGQDVHCATRVVR